MRITIIYMVYALFCLGLVNLGCSKEDTSPTNVLVFFDEESYSVVEGGDTINVSVKLSSAASSQLKIPIVLTLQGNASNNNYVGVPAEVVFEEGETKKSFDVRATDDTADDDGKAVLLEFDSLALPEGIGLGNPSTTTILIIDNDGAPLELDADKDGLIDINNLEQLDAIRYDLDGDGEVDDNAYIANYTAAFGGVAIDADYKGYELIKDLDFEQKNSYRSGETNISWLEAGNAAGWSPIGDKENPYGAILEGNKHKVSNIYINGRRASGLPKPVGLISVLKSGAEVRGLGLAGVNIASNRGSGDIVGGLVGTNLGKIMYCTVEGSVTGGDGTVGILTAENRGASALIAYCSTSGTARGTAVGEPTKSPDKGVGGLVGYNLSTIRGSYSTSRVEGGANVGGLVGKNRSTIIACYTKGNVKGTHNSSRRVGGLVGDHLASALVLACYSASSVTAPEELGGLIGQSAGDIRFCYALGPVLPTAGLTPTYIGGLSGSNPPDSNGADRDNYFDSTTIGQGERRGSAAGGTAKSSEQLKLPTSYTTGGRIYERWNVDIDNNDNDNNEATDVDDPWDFGTSSDYPKLRVDFNGDGTPSAAEFGDQSPPLMP